MHETERKIPTHCSTTPICVDLDEAIVKSKLPWEIFSQAVRTNWLNVFQVYFWLLRGRTHSNHRLIGQIRVNPKSLPYNEELLVYLQAQKDLGRPIYMVSASSNRNANDIARHLRIFNGVLCLVDMNNANSESKAALLKQRFGSDGFVYAGNAVDDIPVWEYARAAIVVDPSRKLSRKLASLVPIEAVIDTQHSKLKQFLIVMRPYQWIKNLLVFVPPLAAHVLTDPEIFTATFTIFLAFSSAASGVYLINDFIDVEADRLHPRKRQRPFASGKLPLWWSSFGVLMLLLGILLGLIVSTISGALLIVYVLLTTAYSLHLKRKPLIDVFTLTALYFTRLFAGGAAANVHISIWLLSFSGFMFLALALLKRSTELSGLSQKTKGTMIGRGYSLTDKALLTTMGVASSFTSVLVLALYVDSEVARDIYASPSVLWVWVPLFLFWQMSLWLAMTRGFMTDDPIVYTAKHWISWLVLALAGIAFALASTGLPRFS